jgi:lauroyl/myristoyl acyltransferase
VQRFPKNLKGTFKDLTGLVFFPIFRSADFFLPVAVFYTILKPFCQVRAILYTVFNRRKKAALPAFLQASQTRRVQSDLRAAFYLNHVLDYFPERLAGAKWKGRCQIEGLEYLQVARQNGRPVILAFYHFGPYFLLRSWLRVAGFPSGSYLAGKKPERTRVRQFTDRFYPWPKITFSPDETNAAAEFLKAGNLLMVALDVPRGRQIHVPFGEDWSFQMAAGAMSLAQSHQADLISCCIVEEGAWNFRIKLGPPVPQEYLALEADWFRAGGHLLAEMLPFIQAHADQSFGNFTQCFKPVPSGSH